MIDIRTSTSNNRRKRYELHAEHGAESFKIGEACTLPLAFLFAQKAEELYDTNYFRIVIS